MRDRALRRKKAKEEWKKENKKRNNKRISFTEFWRMNFWKFERGGI